MKWRICFCPYSERENMRQREKESIHLSMIFPPTPFMPKPGAAAKLIGEREERGGAGSTDQAIRQSFDQ